MNHFSLASVRGAMRRLSRRVGPPAIILLYHRVTQTESDPFMLHVTPEHFEEHLQVIHQVGYPIRLSDLAGRVRERSLPERAVCVTFDDGYVDNLLCAKPLLERYDVPATVFMTTGMSGRRREFWWDELERVFLRPGRLPSYLEFEANGQLYAWDLGGAAVYSEDDFHRDQSWTMPIPEAPAARYDPTVRHTVLQVIHTLLLGMGHTERQSFLDHLLVWAGMAPLVRQTHCALEPDEIVELERGRLVEVGAHTVNHPDLSRQPANVQRHEIGHNKSRLEQILEHPVRSFAYPYGFYSKASVRIVREAGFSYACACSSQSVRRNSDLFLLPRIEVLNWDGETFTRFLRRHLGDC